MAEDRLTELYRRYGCFIYARCVRLLGDRAAAEDATQETFMRVHRHLDKAPGPGEALAWVYRIAADAVRSRLRDVAAGGVAAIRGARTLALPVRAELSLVFEKAARGTDR